MKIKDYLQEATGRRGIPWATIKGGAKDSGFQCKECGHKFKTVKAAEKASNSGCPKCGSSDIDY